MTDALPTLVAPRVRGMATVHDLHVGLLSDPLVNTYGCAIWTSTDAHYQATRLVRERETKLRELIDGERPWAVKTRGSTPDFIGDREKAALLRCEERLLSIHVVRIPIQGLGREAMSLLGYRVRLDEHEMLATLARYADDWTVGDADEVSKIGPVVLPHGAFSLVDLGPVILAHAFRNAPPQLGRPAEECSSEWLGRRCFTRTDIATMWAIEAIARGRDPEGEN